MSAERDLRIFKNFPAVDYDENLPSFCRRQTIIPHSGLSFSRSEIIIRIRKARLTESGFSYASFESTKRMRNAIDMIPITASIGRNIILTAAKYVARYSRHLGCAL